MVSPHRYFVITAINEAKDITLQFMVYPNPANEYLMLEVENYKIESLSYRLNDISGKILMTGRIESCETSITMTSLVSGTYLINIIQGSSNIKTFKIIKN